MRLRHVPGIIRHTRNANPAAIQAITNLRPRETVLFSRLLRHADAHFFHLQAHQHQARVVPFSGLDRGYQVLHRPRPHHRDDPSSRQPRGTSHNIPPNGDFPGKRHLKHGKSAPGTTPTGAASLSWPSGPPLSPHGQVFTGHPRRGRWLPKSLRHAHPDYHWARLHRVLLGPLPPTQTDPLPTGRLRSRPSNGRARPPRLPALCSGQGNPPHPNRSRPLPLDALQHRLGERRDAAGKP